MREKGKIWVLIWERTKGETEIFNSPSVCVCVCVCVYMWSALQPTLLHLKLLADLCKQKQSKYSSLNTHPHTWNTYVQTPWVNSVWSPPTRPYSTPAWSDSHAVQRLAWCIGSDGSSRDQLFSRRQCMSVLYARPQQTHTLLDELITCRHTYCR